MITLLPRSTEREPAAPTAPGQPDWTTDNLVTQQYDDYKVQAVINWINGRRHDGTGNPGTPAIFGMNFQTVSTAQKLPNSRTERDCRATPKAATWLMGPLLVRS